MSALSAIVNYTASMEIVIKIKMAIVCYQRTWYRSVFPFACDGGLNTRFTHEEFVSAEDIVGASESF